MKRILLATAVALALTVPAQQTLAGGPGSAERKLQLGQCTKNGSACTFDCNAFAPACADTHDRCTLVSTDVLTGLLTLSMDDSPCSSRGARLTVTLDAQTRSVGSFTASQTFDYCDKTVPHCDGSIPRPNVFLCDTEQGNTLKEADFVGGSSLSRDWLILSTFPPSMATTIRSHTNGGDPVIVSADDCPGTEDHSNDSLPSVKHFCVKIHMVQRGPTPSATPCF